MSYQRWIVTASLEIVKCQLNRKFIWTKSKYSSVFKQKSWIYFYWKAQLKREQAKHFDEKTEKFYCKQIPQNWQFDKNFSAKISREIL